MAKPNKADANHGIGGPRGFAKRMALGKRDSVSMRHRRRLLPFNGPALLLSLTLCASAKAQVERADVDLTYVTNLAEHRARTLFHSPREDLPGVLRQENLDYDKYRQIRFKPDQAFWAGDGLPIRAEFFHPAAMRRHWGGQTALGVAWGAFAWWLDPVSFWWFSPVLAGLAFSIPISVLTSREWLGRAFLRAGLFATPEEISTPEEIARLHDPLPADEPLEGWTDFGPNRGVCEAVLDPYANALHVSLLRESHLHPHHEAPPRARELGEKLLAHGPEALSRSEQIAVLSDPDTTSWVHREAWLRPAGDLGEPWRAAIFQEPV
jgi:hypothetical protein